MCRLRAFLHGCTHAPRRRSCVDTRTQDTAESAADYAKETLLDPVAAQDMARAAWEAGRTAASTAAGSAASFVDDVLDPDMKYAGQGGAADGSAAQARRSQETELDGEKGTKGGSDKQGRREAREALSADEWYNRSACVRVLGVCGGVGFPAKEAGQMTARTSCLLAAWH